jgi:hypothetical protein
MKVGDLVKMDFEDNPFQEDAWGIGVIVEICESRFTEGRHNDDMHVLWPEVGLSWEMCAMLEKVDEKY